MSKVLKKSSIEMFRKEILVRPTEKSLDTPLRIMIIIRNIVEGFSLFLSLDKQNKNAE